MDGHAEDRDLTRGWLRLDPTRTLTPLLPKTCGSAEAACLRSQLLSPPLTVQTALKDGSGKFSELSSFVSEFYPASTDRQLVARFINDDHQSVTHRAEYRSSSAAPAHYPNRERTRLSCARIMSGSPRRGGHSSFGIQSFLQDENDYRLGRRQAENSTIPRGRLTYGIPHYRTTGTSIIQNPSVDQGSASFHGSLARLTFASSSQDTASVSTSIGVRDAVPRVLDIDEHGNAEARPGLTPVPFECPFDRLNCRLTFFDFDDWYAHSLSHFKDKPPPATNQCPLCEAPKFVARTGEQSWSTRMEHVAEHHRYGLQLGRTARFDHELYRYLWHQRIIDDFDYKQITGGRTPTVADQVYPSPPTSPSAASTEDGSAYTDIHRRRFQRAPRRLQ